VNPLLEEELARLGGRGESGLLAVRERGSLRDELSVPLGLRRRFPIALEIGPQWHLRMQAAFQEHIDAGVSKTVNLPAACSPRTVREVFELARRLGLKGITVYRDGSRPAQTLSTIERQVSPECRECAA
jgi:ribonucleoside-diphosphate reductase alpha chain